MRTNVTIDLTTEQLELLGRSLGRKRATRADVRFFAMAALKQVLRDLERVEQRTAATEPTEPEVPDRFNKPGLRENYLRGWHQIDT